MPRSAFTVLELMVAILIIAVLAGIAFPVIGHFRKQAPITLTTTLVNTVAAAVSAYETREWSFQQKVGGTPQFNADGTPRLSLMRLWDLNGDGLLDGLPGATAGASDRDCDPPFTSAVIDSGYTGFVAMTGISLESRFLNARRQVTDAWGNPLRIVWDVDAYGSAGFGLWSMGPDGKTATAAEQADDIASWKLNQKR